MRLLLVSVVLLIPAIPLTRLWLRNKLDERRERIARKHQRALQAEARRQARTRQLEDELDIPHWTL